jgi:2-oxoglutarate dehydrogenase E1 component
MTPKSLLRHKLAVSSPQDLMQGPFHPVLSEIDEIDPAIVKKIVICSGKVYYDVLEQRRERGINDVVIIRLEQVHPFPTRELVKEIRTYPAANEVAWCQEEPKNQGCWYQISYYLGKMLGEGQVLSYVGREGSPSPAVGFYKLHVKQQQDLVDGALAVRGETE